MPLVGCPFCRELFPLDEASLCPVCGVPLRPVEKLPLSYEAQLALAEELAATHPADRRVSFWFVRRGRGALLAIAVLGLVAFFLPWVELHLPDELSLSGYSIARTRGAWFFGGPVGWLTLIPLVLTRRTIHQMRGVRVIAAAFSGLSVIEVVQLLTNPPRGGRYVPVAFEWGPGLHATLALGLAGVLVAARFGGRVDDVDERELRPQPEPRGSTDIDEDRTLH